MQHGEKATKKVWDALKATRSESLTANQLLIRFDNVLGNGDTQQDQPQPQQAQSPFNSDIPIIHPELDSEIIDSGVPSNQH